MEMVRKYKRTSNMYIINRNTSVKGKAIHVQAYSSPKGSRKPYYTRVKYGIKRKG